MSAKPGGLLVSQADHYEIISTTPLSNTEIGITLVKTYLGLPALLFGPVIVAIILMSTLRNIGTDIRPGTLAFYFFIAVIFAALINFYISLFAQFEKLVVGSRNFHL